jgi:hypothetical protein
MFYPASFKKVLPVEVNTVDVFKIRICEFLQAFL